MTGPSSVDGHCDSSSLARTHWVKVIYPLNQMCPHAVTSARVEEFACSNIDTFADVYISEFSSCMALAKSG